MNSHLPNVEIANSSDIVVMYCLMIFLKKMVQLKFGLKSFKWCFAYKMKKYLKAC